MRDAFIQMPDERDHVLAQILNKNWAELEALEHAGYLLFPEKLFKRRKDGKFEAISVIMRVPREPERRAARVEARQRAQADGLDPQLDSDLIEELETISILWRAIRSPTPPYEPFTADAAELERVYDRPCLMQAYAKLDALHRILDPAPSSMTEGEMLALISALAKERSVLPLAVFGPGARDFFVITMAERLLTLTGSK